MASSGITMASNAMVLLGGSSFAAFTEEKTEARIASQLYETSYLSILTSHRWNFAKKKQVLSRLTTPPLNGYNYAFQIPSDCLYVIDVDSHNYDIFEDKVFSNAQELSMNYTFRVNEDVVPAYFAKMMEFYLAAQFSIPLTGDLSKADMFEKKFEREARTARHADSTQRPNIGFRDSPYVSVRY